MRKLVVFGVGDLARLVRTHLEADSDYQVVAFTLHAGFIDDATCEGLPVVPFEMLATTHPPETTDLFVAIGYRNVNRLRADVVDEAKRAGYHLATYVSTKAVITGQVVIGENSMVLDGTVIQHNVTIGRNVLVWSGCHISHDSVIGDHVYVAPRAALAGRVTVEPYAFIGLNASIRDHVTIGAESIVGMGAVILDDTPPASVTRAPGGERMALKSHELESL